MLYIWYTIGYTTIQFCFQQVFLDGYTYILFIQYLWDVYIEIYLNIFKSIPYFTAAVVVFITIGHTCQAIT